MTKHYDPEKVEALLGLLLDEGDGWTDAKIVSTMLKIQALATALRSSAREAEEASDGEIDKWLREQGWTLIQPEDYDFIRAVLARFAAPRGRVVEGWALLNHEERVVSFSDQQPPAHAHARWIPCLITIPAAPPRGEEG